jgi:hypothetical protein
MKRVLTVLGVLLIAASTVQTASAARHGRKAAHAYITQQSRDSGAIRTDARRAKRGDDQDGRSRDRARSIVQVTATGM